MRKGPDHMIISRVLDPGPAEWMQTRGRVGIIGPTELGTSVYRGQLHVFAAHCVGRAVSKATELLRYSISGRDQTREQLPSIGPLTHHGYTTPEMAYTGYLRRYHRSLY
ncbi:hypothetical protein J6590_058358 [Homalodisca vitripennis]|nr:hypothetical protein J6590_058358 [Homalodisca vitripennis]